MPPPQIVDIHKTIELDRNTWAANPLDVKIYRAYASGIHDLNLSIGQKEMLEGILGHRFCDNICNQIIDTNANELILEGYKCPDKAVQDYADSFWLLNQFDDETNEAHFATLRDADYCMRVEYDIEAGRVICTREPWWDGTTGVFIGYDARGFMLYAVRQWIDGDHNIRRIVYYDGFFERYISKDGSTWFPYLLNNVAGSNVEIMVRPDNTPLDIPFIHFANPGRGPSNYGFSAIGGGVIGFNDQINDLHIDISAAARLTGFQELWFAGWALETDPKTQLKIPLKRGPGVAHVTTNVEATAGAFPAGSIEEQIKAYTMKLQAVCRMTSTPYHLITGGDWPSGEALWQSMKPLYKKAGKQQKRLGPAWILLLHRAIELENVYGGLGLNEDVKTAPISVEWCKNDRRDPLTEAMADKSFWDAANAAILAGCPLAAFLKIQGYEQTQIDEILRLQAEQQVKDLQHEQKRLEMQMNTQTDAIPTTGQ